MGFIPHYFIFSNCCDFVSLSCLFVCLIVVYQLFNCYMVQLHNEEFAPRWLVGALPLIRAMQAFLQLCR